ncbi:hypothetical protein [Encephalitozoon cuniculi GB-M1]|uniref:Uncharacterized protein n=2 Tax=Encephalitozoon cuniculi TaxID=6035 RepID=Q8SUN4_ENCCU|nr:uncharacterized protein ECU08_1230 [Encephalitozoon cuniculi GB-M1]CAD26429.3 hypothetical protein [Encephalitozoon cuniculi GB-M1]
MHRKTMTESLAGYKTLGIVRRSKGLVISSAIDVATGEMVILEEVDLLGVSEDCGPLLMGFLLNHELNHSPYAMKVLRCFQDGGRVCVVQKYMSLGPVDVATKEQAFLSDDFILYVFMQVVYAMKINSGEKWFWDRISTRHVWIDGDGKVRLCWADVVLEDVKAAAEQMSIWSRAVEDKEKVLAWRGTEMEDSGPVYLGSLRRIFVGLALRSSDSLETSGMICAKEWGASPSVGHRQGFSSTLSGFASLLFEDGGRIEDLEGYTRRMIQERRIASNPREIFKSLIASVREANRDHESNILEEIKECAEGIPKMEEGKSSSFSEESSKSMSEDGSKGDDERVGSFGTREYKRGRFHVCEAVPLGEKEKSLQAGEQMKRIVRIVNAQSRQIRILTKVFKQLGLLGKEVSSELVELEELVNFLLVGMERQ